MRASLIVAVAGVALAAGCSSKLETGYRPQKLKASEAERRAFYADPYSVEARAADGKDGSNHYDPHRRRQF